MRVCLRCGRQGSQLAEIDGVCLACSMGWNGDPVVLSPGAAARQAVLAALAELDVLEKVTSPRTVAPCRSQLLAARSALDLMKEP